MASAELRAAGARPPLSELIRLVGEVAVPMCNIKRTMVLPLKPERRENVAEHSFTLAILACSLASALDRELDLGRVAQYAIAHDLVELYAGDTSVWASPAELKLKNHREMEAMARIRQEFGETFPWLIEVIVSYESKTDPESRFVYALDKVVPHISILVAGKHPVRPSYDDYLQSINTARRKIGDDAEVLGYFEGLIDLFDRHPDFFAATDGKSG